MESVRVGGIVGEVRREVVLERRAPSPVGAILAAR